MDSTDTEQEILRAMRKFNRPMTTDALAVLLKKQPRDITEKMRSMEKFRKVKKSCKTSVYFWDLL